MLFQNSIKERGSKKYQPGSIQMLQESVKQSAKFRSLDHLSPYQLLIKVKRNTENEVKHQKRLQYKEVLHIF